eukprot:2019925-Ditylum_brightwellii.AAC.1
MESPHTNVIGEKQELLNINSDEQLLTQESVQGNETDQNVGNVTIKDKSVVKEPVHKDMGKML